MQIKIIYYNIIFIKLKLNYHFYNIALHDYLNFGTSQGVINIFFIFKSIYYQLNFNSRFPLYMHL